ncbi:MAG: hypothetical protein KIY12_06315 [Thermoplasmata archaeon]|uniref:Uncharacterized protein n=1 Tax=Candidatus Sysuiplasma superficiale TaxID=2823368 RepID=A0A8J7YLW9_9ARCH|nr:hypothetical protein [Candidatus Sysuiplasma superficiale]MBX8644316.1 hypothetical protein [Candidatus Sysuiplasma superficiale]MCL4347396.1 hypothetical protein [Candidatus Thermoplasmatota archaeon]
MMVTEPGEVRNAIKRAVESERSSIINTMADPDERPILPKIRTSQTFCYSTALFR